jgi:hypothetical protein
MGTLHDKKKGLQKNLADFAQELEAKFPDAVLTSGYRPGAKTTQGKASRHSHGEAVDFSINPKLASYLESPEGVSLLYKYKLGFLDESKKENKKWGNALHIGQDSALWKQTEAKYNKLFPQQPKEEVTGNVNFFDYIPKSSTFTESIETQEEDPEEEEETVDPQIKEVEEATNFLNEYEAQTTQDVPTTQYKDKIDLSNIAEANFLDEYDKIDNFLSTPTAQQGTKYTEKEQGDQKWLTDWYTNRNIPYSDLQEAYLNDKDFYLKKLKSVPKTKNVSIIGNDPRVTGQYDHKKNTISITPKAQDTDYLHELNHYSNAFPSYMRTVHEEVVNNKKVQKDHTKGIYNEKYEYFTNPDEVHSRIQVLRKKAGINPSEDVSEEYLKNYLDQYDGLNSNINDLLNTFDEKGILELLNTMADNSKVNKNNYAQQGPRENKLTFLQPTSDKLPIGYRIPYTDTSSERAMSIGGEGGEPAYLIPSFKYGKDLSDPIGEYKRTGEHLGGPFKTWQEAEEWEREVRHPAVEKREQIPFPQQKFQQGGSNYTDNEQAFLSELQQGNIVKDNNGYWDPKNWGKTVEISGPNITMKGVNQPLYGYSPETGEKKLMVPGKDYYFKGAKRVIETPLKNKNSKL